MRLWQIGVTLIGFSLMSPAFADLEAFDLWARSSVPGVDNGVVYGTLDNRGDAPAAVVGVVSDVARQVSMHRTQIRQGLVSMVPVPRLVLSPGDSVRLSPGGMHIMLMGLKRPLKEGASFDITFLLEDGTRITKSVTVGSPGQMEVPQN